jgi:hypothetical protein
VTVLFEESGPIAALVLETKPLEQAAAPKRLAKEDDICTTIQL